MYDYLIVGSGIYGSVYAHEKTKQGHKCLIIDQRNHIGGNCYTEKIENIQVHKYGPHIFNTNNLKIWQYVNNIIPFETYIHKVKVNYNGELFSMPINLNTFSELWGINTPKEAREEIEKLKIPKKNIISFEDYVLANLGQELFEIFYKGYTEKQWNKTCSELPASIAKRLPIRFIFDDRYHETTYSGIPANGNYTAIFEKLLDGIEVKLNEPYSPTQVAKNIVYTGPIDELFNYQFGPLEYRSLRWETKILDTDNFQGISQINYSDKEIPYTRSIEHKCFSPKVTEKTVVSYEYPEAWETGKERYYPVNNPDNDKIYKKYKMLAEQSNILVSGRLGLFKYLDMDAVVALALKDSN